MDVGEFHYTVHRVPLLRFSNFSATGFGIKLHQVMCFFVCFLLFKSIPRHVHITLFHWWSMKPPEWHFSCSTQSWVVNSHVLTGFWSLHTSNHVEASLTVQAIFFFFHFFLKNFMVWEGQRCSFVLELYVQYLICQLYQINNSLENFGINCVL